MIIRLFSDEQIHALTTGYGRRRRCRLAPSSPHVYRRALLYRLGIADGRRPAVVFNTIAQALRSARV
ncbi:MAG: hypothetical protein J7456_10755 [Chloroflexus sp.]|jgi:hypothetical protein|uniref:hypothetical protein n=1 Tax=unclassified Chloroflexus TaxID=2633855 RepID=UPI0004DF07A8|nr:MULTISPECIES: hypothetical protein [unclassified Chloroflexus]MBO9313359.1 hypothetical protein [Chloroflexus sp.]MBO9316248.1 hypothetical protein [Chloroflexus sp.]MBO9319128.1 hypothetical protein [Chloroflexus sp.]MBO9372391.1 hypothetical protein [Chloroflexus sp.]MDN5273675.1 hypothetical protein [Chloroflexus sp. MS-CIW-1]